jgi:cell division protein FtsZ
MVDEKLDDQVWVTVVATGYGRAKDADRDGAALHEPAGEPRVRRTSPRASSAGVSRTARRDSLSVQDLEVPEFIPNR